MLLYKDGGPHQRPGGYFDFKDVPEDKLTEALENGWFRTMTGVTTGKDPESKVLVAPVQPQVAKTGSQVVKTRGQAQVVKTKGQAQVARTK